MSRGQYPATRMRRNRMKAFSRRMLAEHRLSVDDLIWPLFVIEGEDRAEPVSSMPGVSRHSIDRLAEQAREAVRLGIPAVAVFPSIDPALKDNDGTLAGDANNLVCRAVRAVKDACPDLGVICDVALDPFTDHGHDGILRDGEIVNDETVETLCRQAVCQADAGCDIIAPSDMMDGRVAAIRAALDEAGHQNVQIMSYAAKYASGFYGPFREAVSAGKLAGADGFAERAVEAGGVFRRVGHDLHILVARLVERGADGGDTAVHHVGRRDDIAAGVCLAHGLAAERLNCLVIHDLAIAQDAVMAVVGERVERDIADDAEVRAGILDRAHGPADEVVRVAGQGAVIVLQRRVNRRKDGNGRNAKAHRFPRLLGQPVDAVTRDAGHGRHGLGPVFALDDEQRPDQVVDRQPVLGQHAARERLHPVAAHACGRVLTSAHLRSKSQGRGIARPHSGHIASIGTRRNAAG